MEIFKIFDPDAVWLVFFEIIGIVVASVYSRPFPPAEFVQQILRHHHISNADQSTLHLICIKLVNQGKWLELTASAPVQLSKGNSFMYFGNRCFCPVITVCIHRQYFSSIPEEHIVHTPGINREAVYLWELGFGCLNAVFYFPQQCIYVPHQMALIFMYTVRKTIHFLCSNLTVLLPAYNMPARRRTDINS